MQLFHKTKRENTESIISEGFRDGEGLYFTQQGWRGVWMSDEPIYPIRDGGDTLFTIDIPEDVILEFEWVEEGKPVREFLVPAALVKSIGHPLLKHKCQEGTC